MWATQDHRECARFLKGLFIAKDIDVTVSELPPLVATGYEALNMHCPHGVMFYAEPTSEQRAVWAREDKR